MGRFFDSLGRQYSTANKALMEFVLEHLKLCIILLNAIKLNLHELRSSTSSASENSADVETIQHYNVDSEEILDICHVLSVKWEQKIDEINATTSNQTLQTQLLGSSRGCPHFDIQREQLLYLSSMSFSWTDIARMLGVSHMTIYRRRVEYGLLQDQWWI